MVYNLGTDFKRKIYMRNKIIALLIALLGATTPGFAQDDISISTGIIGNGRLLGAKTYDGQTTVGILGIDSSGNTIIKSLSGSDVLFPSNLKIANNTYIQARNAAGTADINVLKVDASDDTIIASDTGDTVIIAPAGNTDVTFEASQMSIGSANYQVVPGSSSYTIRNNADDTNNFLFNNDGSLGIGGTNKKFYSSAELILGVDADLQRVFTFDGSSDTALTLKFGDAGVTAAQNFTLSGSTSDADDDSTIFINAGGAASQTRGAGILFYGNEAAGTPGELNLNSGSIATSDVIITATDDFRVRDFADASSLTIDVATKASTFGGTVTSTATSDLGWSAVNAANQACNTTCTSACVFGMNTGALGNFVGCADATADTCICAGAS